MNSMEFPRASGIPSQETIKTYRIEHLPQADVVLNLDYTSPEEVNIALQILKDMGEDLIEELMMSHYIGPKNDKHRFFLKHKNPVHPQIDFLRGRSEDDPITPKFAKDFDSKARYAKISVLSEISISPEVKRLVESDAFQELARKYGFLRMTFEEPIAGVVQPYGSKHLIYKNIENAKWVDSRWQEYKLGRFSRRLRGLFLANGIIAHDLRAQQFLITEQDGYRILHLIDVEAYTKAK